MKSACRRIGISRWPYSRSRNEEAQGRAGEEVRSDSDFTLEEGSSVAARDRHASEGQSERESEEEHIDAGDMDFIPIERRWIEWFTRVNFDDDISFR